MKTVSQYFFAIFCFVLLLACEKENNPTPTDRNLPQGFTVYDEFSFFNSATILENEEIVIAGILVGERKLKLLRLDRNCNQVWSRSYFEVNNNLTKITKQKNDGLVITGNLNITSNIAGLDKDGNEIWCNKNVENLGLINGLNAIQTMDNGILAVGAVLDSGFHAFVVKYNEEGEEIWRNKYKDDSFFLEGFYPIETDDGDIIISTSKLIPPQSSLAFLKITSEGEKIWVRDIELPLFGIFSNIKTIKTIDNESLTIMNSPRDDFASISTPIKARIAKVDLNGWIKWTKEISIGMTNSASSILELATGEILFLGSVSQENENLKAVLIKMDNQGNEIWRQTYGAEQDFTSRDILETTEGFLIVGNFTETLANGDFNYTATILKVDKEGNPL